MTSLPLRVQVRENKECGKLLLQVCERSADAPQGDGDWTRRSDTPEKSDDQKLRGKLAESRFTPKK